eukprot:scaffold270851_cov23-Tisochrysis_lutea.AAC.1
MHACAESVTAPQSYALYTSHERAPAYAQQRTPDPRTLMEQRIIFRAAEGVQGPAGDGGRRVRRLDRLRCMAAAG